MTMVYLWALLAIALSLCVLMALAFLVQQRTGNSGWVDTIWTFAVGLVGAGSALWPIAGAAPNARQWLVAALVAIWSLRLGLHIAVRTAHITDDPRYASFAKAWGLNAPRRMFVFLQNQALGSIPLAFAIFVAARFPDDALRWQDCVGRADPVHGNRRRSAGGLPAQALPHQSRQQGPRLRCRPVALVAPSQLFLRVVLLAGLSGDRALARLSMGTSPRCSRRSSCTGSWSTSPASRRSKSRCCARAASAIARTSPEPASSFRCRLAHEKDHAPKKGEWSHELRLHRHQVSRTRAAAGRDRPRRDPPALLAFGGQARRWQRRA